VARRKKLLLPQLPWKHLLLLLLKPLPLLLLPLTHLQLPLQMLLRLLRTQLLALLPLRSKAKQDFRGLPALLVPWNQKPRPVKGAGLFCW
jgi:hypothetical protein